MSRAARLLSLIDALRRRRRPVTAETLAADLGISVRTVYRDVATLRGEGAPIDGEAGVGYLLRPGFTLPPLSFTIDELEALALGVRFVAARGDTRLARAAETALARIEAVLPEARRGDLDDIGLMLGPGRDTPPAGVDSDLLRRAIREETRLELDYRDAAGRDTRRTVWPMALAFFERVSILVAWCESRADFRHFRLDRISAARPTGERYPRRRRALMRDWRLAEGIDPAGAKKDS
jgi:predicted DNA-binding transcriptional regulator YafY